MSEINEILKSLQLEYISEIPLKVNAIKEQIKAKQMAELRNSFHKLKGTGKTYGLPEISDLAEVTEKVCLSSPAQAVDAATLAVEVLGEIHRSRQKQQPYSVGIDLRFKKIQDLAAAPLPRGPGT